MAEKTIMTPDELRDNYEFKVVKRMLMREFPWIKDISFIEEELNRYGLVFLDIYFNPYELQKIKGWPIMQFTQRIIDREGVFNSPYLSTPFSVPYDVTHAVTDELEELMKSIHESPAIPKDMRMPEDRRFSIGSYKAVGSPPEGYEPILTKDKDPH